MKKTLATIAMLAPALLMAQQQYIVNGKIGKLNSPAKAYLSYRTANGNVTDSAAINAGSFTFKGNLAEPLKATLIIAHHGENLRTIRRPDALAIYLESGKIAINSPDSVLRAKVSGYDVNKINDELNRVLAPFEQQRKLALAAYRAQPEAQRNGDALDKQLEAINVQQKTVLPAFIKKYNQSVVALDALKTYGGYFPEATEVAPLYAQLGDQVKSSAAGQQYSTWLDGWKKTALGAQAPLFTQQDKDGKAVTLASFKGKYVLVDFWASWCGPCRRENPNVVKAFNRFKDKNFTILGVSLDSKKEAWLKAVADDQLNWTQVSDLKYWSNEVAQLYGVRAIPQNFLLDPSGKIIAKNLSGEQLSAKLHELFTDGSQSAAVKASTK